MSVEVTQYLMEIFVIFQPTGIVLTEQLEKVRISQ